MSDSATHPFDGPARDTWAAFDALHDAPARWLPAVTALAERFGGGPVVPMGEGTALVARLGDDRFLKVYPPFLADHAAFEAAMLPHLHGRLSLPTPALLAHEQHRGWPVLLISRVPGEPLTAHWPTMTEADRLRLLHTLGGLINEVQALPLGEMARLALPWPEHLARQRAGCRARQQRTGLPAHLLAQVDDFVAGPLPDDGPTVLLTGEYTPMNLMVQDGRLSAMFDFGDGLIGPGPSDWLGPLCFLAAGHAPRVQALMDGLGATLTDGLRDGLMRLLLLHRYSALQLQIACPGWQAQPDFSRLARFLWP